MNHIHYAETITGDRFTANEENLRYIKTLFPEKFAHEKIVFIARPHRIFLFKNLFLFGGISLLILITPILLLLGGNNAKEITKNPWFWLFWFFSLLIAGTTIYAKFFNWKYDLYIVTDRRLIDSNRRFPFFKKVTDASLNKIQNITFQMNGLWANLLKYGDILVETAGDVEGTELQLKKISHPINKQMLLERAIEEYMKKNEEKNEKEL